MRKFSRFIWFYAITTLASFLIYIYPLIVLQYFINNQTQSNISSFLQTIVTSLLLVYYFKAKSTFYPLKMFVYLGLGIGFIAFWVVNLCLLAYLLLTINAKTVGYICLITIFFLTGYSHISALFIIKKKIILETKKLNKNYCLILASDIHLGSNNNHHLKKLINKFKTVSADAILISGDLIDSSSFNIQNLELFKQLTAPIFFVTGNHEHYLEGSNEILKALKNYNIVLLDNNNIVLDELNIIGISDNSSLQRKIRITKQLKKQKLFNICLVHQPSIWQAIRNDMDIMFSGHTHKGQIFPFYYFVKLKFKFIYGLYNHKNNRLIVSSGAGTWGPKMRLGSFNEIVELKIQKINDTRSEIIN